MHNRISGERGGGRSPEAGFSLIEMVTVIIVLGVILGIGGVNYANISNSLNLSAAEKQAEAAITRAKLSARQENVEYHIIFYPDGSAASANTYEFRCFKQDKDTGDWSLQPVNKSVGGEVVRHDGTSWFIELGSKARISEEVTIIFRPRGTEMEVMAGGYEVIPEGGRETVEITVGRMTGGVSVDAQGRVEFE